MAFQAQDLEGSSWSAYRCFYSQFLGSDRTRMFCLFLFLPVLICLKDHLLNSAMAFGRAVKVKVKTSARDSRGRDSASGYSRSSQATELSGVFQMVNAWKAIGHPVRHHGFQFSTLTQCRARHRNRLGILSGRAKPSLSLSLSPRRCKLPQPGSTGC